MGIEDDKQLLGFERAMTGLYKKWRDAIKAHMTANKFTSRSTAGTEKWAALTEYALTLKPLSPNTSVHGAATKAGFAMQKALDSLLTDVGKKLKDSDNLYGGIELVDKASSPGSEPKGMLNIFYSCYFVLC